MYEAPLYTFSHGLQYTRLLCPPLSPRVCLNSCLLSWWYYLTISSSVIPFCFCLKSFPASESFPVSQLFPLGGQSIRASASASVLPVNIQVWFPLGWLGGSPCSPRDSQESCPTPQFKTINSSLITILYGPTVTSIHDNWKNHSFDYTELFQQSNLSTFKNFV